MILKWLRSGRPLTPVEALERFGCFRLAARIADLRQQGHNINTSTISKHGKEFAEYRLIEGRP